LPGFFLFACFFERARYLASDSMLQLEGYLKIYMRSFEGVLLYQAHPGCILSYLFKRERFIPSFYPSAEGKVECITLVHPEKGCPSFREFLHLS
jgi:hypothetical protein